jgi:hypothetical protein
MSSLESIMQTSLISILDQLGIQVLSAVKNSLSTGLLITQQVSMPFSLNTVSIEIFFHALEKNHYDCWLGPKQALPMIYVDDVIKATIQFLKAPKSDLKRQVYNLGGMSFTPE